MQEQRKRNLYLVVSGVTLVFTICAALGAFFLLSHGTPAAKAAPPPMHLDCGGKHIPLCTDVGESDEIFGAYKGHDEPALLFYSDKPGSGNRAQFNLTLPKDPTPQDPLTPGKSYNF